jgi:Ca-activated chloride channel family protein
MVVISDGQANEGIWNRDELAAHAATTALTGISISSVGVGLDFDEVTMVRLANVARGNYYFVEDTSGLDAMFARELGGLDDTIATNAKLVLTATPHARITDAYGYPLGHVGEHVIIPVSDLRAGEVRKVVVRMRVTPVEGVAVPLAKVELGWTSPASNALRRAGTQAIAELVEDAADLVVDPSTLAAIEAARTARALEEAGNVYELHGAEAARQVLELRAGAISPHLDAASVDHEHQLNEAALELLRSAPASKVKKTFSETAYKLAR